MISRLLARTVGAPVAEVGAEEEELVVELVVELV
jgi:hypothetical protein